MNASLILVQTTVSEQAAANRLAAEAVEARLAACVQETAITSHFRWDGAVQAATEWRLDFKTSADGLSRLLHWLEGAHPYEVPEILVMPVGATGDYADWVVAETKQER